MNEPRRSAENSDRPTKQCAQCGEVKPLAQFAVDRRYKGGRNIRCVSCDAKFRRKHGRRPRKADVSTRKESIMRWREAVRTEVFDHYGRSCACCGIIPDRPEIDHIDGKGREHRAQGSSGGSGIYSWLIKNDFPEGFQTLCGTCNRAKGASDTCPLHNPRAA